jgi:hypothetical protein
LQNEFQKALKILVFFVELKLKLLVEFIEKVQSSDDYMFSFSNHLLENTYFIFNEANATHLITLEYFTEKACDTLQIQVNSFNHNKLEWASDLQIEDKFSNFHKCALRTMEIFKFSSSEDGRNEVFDGWRRYIHQALAQKLNATPEVVFFKLDSLSTSEYPYKKKPFHFTPEMKLMFEVERRYHMVQTYLQTKIYILITPSEKFTSFEKLLLPFDLTTWCLTILVFLIAFSTIVVINRLGQQLRHLIYGQHVKTPALNIVMIFFGISQVKLPSANFPRMILIFFIYFCLIIRSGYQGVMFEMITSDMHKKSPDTIDDLIAQDFTIYNSVLELSNDSVQLMYRGLFK